MTFTNRNAIIYTNNYGIDVAHDCESEKLKQSCAIFNF
nr:MAG TPA: hypothetical protein [Caudoviricetes sp.]